MDLNKESYNKIIEQWYEARNKSSLNKCVIDFALKIQPNGKILDIGCGTGYPISKYLSDRGLIVTGIDISENMLNKAVELNLANAQFYLCDFFEYQPIEKYDGIIAFDSFFHFPQERQAEIYSKISTWTNIGAYLLFTHGKENSELTDCMYDEIFYYSSLSTQEVHKLLSDNGFAIETSVEDYKEETTGERGLLIIAKKVR